MDVFQFRTSLIDEYASYVNSFITIRDRRIHDHVEERLRAGDLWPDPLIQLNPAFETGGWIDDLVQEGVLHPECARIFRVKPSPDDGGRRLRLHRHQEQAIRTARGGSNYVLTTGTGSGKSLAYLVPIVDHVLRRGSGRGIQAIVVYPMNALANSQWGELEKFLCHGYAEGSQPVTFQKYTGQEDDEERQKILANPPDILLTNYVMLELILTRPYEQKLVAAAQGLRFLVLDELHTYRGRQGADVALLMRRTREAMTATNLQQVGTSATLAGDGSLAQQQREVAQVASLLFGAEVRPEHVIGETLRRVTPARDLDDPGYIRALSERVRDRDVEPSPAYEEFVQDPLSTWIESTFGVTEEPESRRLVRATPRSISGENGAACKLSESTGVDEECCAAALQASLLAGYRCAPNANTGLPPFAFRLHQFISRGDAVYASLEEEETRYITLHGQQYVPGDRGRLLLPLVFCRECGQEYYSVWMTEESGSGRRVFRGRELTELQGEGEQRAGYLYCSGSNPWPEEMEELLNRLPEDWLEERRGMLSVRRDRRKDLPQPVRLGANGAELDDGLPCSLIAAPFRFCLQCGVEYAARQTDFAKLSTLSSEGRSTATTILSLFAVRGLRAEQSLPETARKLLSFTDNRQDASLQAGHFNDFVEIGLLRSALYRAVRDAGEAGLGYDELTQHVFDALDLPLELYAGDPKVRFAALTDTKRALREVLGYNLYRDLKRGWRITSPNLEQCGLLQIRYRSLDEVCEAEDLWQNRHPALVTAGSERRLQVAGTLLDFMRRALAIRVDSLDQTYQERIQQQSSQRLIAPWALDESETRQMEHGGVLFPRASSPHDNREHVFLGPRSRFGQYLRRQTTFPDFAQRLTLADSTAIIADLLEALQAGGLVEMVAPPSADADVPGYQIPASALLWLAGDGLRPFHDPLQRPTAGEEGGRTNRFFVDFYRTVAGAMQGYEAREHTAQVPYDLRIDRERRFREGSLPVLYCSPTMELGVDIADLNVVNLRNVPPTPANYAQRSGRAGRNGQPALVFSYCSTFWHHDQYFFKRPEQMVAGAVAPPRLDVANEDLVRAHVQAIWLAETGLSLGSSLRDVLELGGERPSLALIESVREAVERAW
ncbi:MAG: DEAD/DEAH box helicase, partial [Dehalococcoidia bacterium]